MYPCEPDRKYQIDAIAKDISGKGRQSPRFSGRLTKRGDVEADNGNQDDARLMLF